MPQLSPDPWFTILLSSWLVLLILPPKVASHRSFNEPATQGAEKPKPFPWNWPWS
nr:ATP synthase F0 subunit 8 [Pipa arrabali]